MTSLPHSRGANQSGHLILIHKSTSCTRTASQCIPLKPKASKVRANGNRWDRIYAQLIIQNETWERSTWPTSELSLQLSHCANLQNKIGSIIIKRYAKNALAMLSKEHTLLWIKPGAKCASWSCTHKLTHSPVLVDWLISWPNNRADLLHL